MGDKVHLIKLSGALDDSFIFAQSTWLDEDLHMTLLHEGSAFLCSVTAEMLQTMSKDLPDVAAWATEAFTTSCKKYQFSILNGAELIWRKADGGSKIKIKIGSFPLKKISLEDAQSEIFGNAITRIDDLSAKHADLSERHNKMLSDLRESRSKLAELAKVKEEVEKELYGQFLPLLQSKQDKIAELTSQLGSGGGDGGKEEEDYGSGTDVDDDDDEESPKKQAKMADKSLNESQNFLEI